jgi:hypothetical protein
MLRCLCPHDYACVHYCGCRDRTTTTSDVDTWNGDDFNVCNELWEWWQVWAATGAFKGRAEISLLAVCVVADLRTDVAVWEAARVAAPPGEGVAGAVAHVRAGITDLDLLADSARTATVGMYIRLQTRPQAWISVQAAVVISRSRGSTPVNTETLALWGFLGLCAGVVLNARGRDACPCPPNLNDNGRPQRAGVAERFAVHAGGHVQLLCTRLLLVGVLRKRALAMAESAAAERLRKDLQKLAQLAAGMVVDVGTGVAASVDAEMALGLAATGAPAVARQLLCMEPRTGQGVRLQARQQGSVAVGMTTDADACTATHAAQ